MRHMRWPRACFVSDTYRPVATGLHSFPCFLTCILKASLGRTWCRTKNREPLRLDTLAEPILVFHSTICAGSSVPLCCATTRLAHIPRSRMT